MAIKELQTRIALKYDSYTNWTDKNLGADKGANFVLLKGEIGICEIPSDFTANSDSRVMPTVLFKVGNGTSKFYELPWASAKAADVYGWAKSETVVLEGTTLKFKTGDTVNHSIDLSSFATDAEVATIKAALEARISALEISGGAGGDIGKALADHETRLNTLEGTDDVEGSVANAIKVAKAYTDAREVEINKYADQAEADAVKHANELNTAMNTRVGTLEAAKSAQDTTNTTLNTLITNETTAREAADKDITDTLGTGFDKGDNTVAKKIAAAQTAAETNAAATAQSKVDALRNGQVETNRTAIAALDANYKAADAALDNRITTVEGKLADVTNVMDFRGAVEALPTTTEGYQDGDVIVVTQGDHAGREFVLSNGAFVEFGYADGNTTAITGLLGRMSTAEGDIDKLETAVAGLNAADTAMDQRIITLEGTVTAGDADTLQAAKNYAYGVAATAESNAKTHAETKASAAQTAAEATAKSYTDSQTNTLEAAVNAKIAALDTRVGTAEGAITTLQSIVSTGANANTTLRADISELQSIARDGADKNTALRADLTTLQGIVSKNTTDLAAVTKTANEASAKAASNETRIKTIEDDYLTSVDEFIFNCGSSAEVAHNK
jgi:uncharacterized coiled-coil protein SlyX